MTFNVGDAFTMTITSITGNSATATLEKQETETKPPEEKPIMTPYALSKYVVQKEMKRPSVGMFQMLATELAKKYDRADWTPDKIDHAAGDEYERISKSIQEFYQEQGCYTGPIDAEIGKGSWRCMTGDVPTWRAPLRLRIAECQCSFESGRHGYGYYGMIPAEGWYNFGIWNVNEVGSLMPILELGGRTDLYAKRNSAPQEVAWWFGGHAGREIQVGSYLDKYVLRPSIKNILKAGFKDFPVSPDYDEFPDSLDPFWERLLLQSCDITINSGASGYFRTRSPYYWDADSGERKWPEGRVPPKEDCKKIFAKYFSDEILKDDSTWVQKDQQASIGAINEVLWTLCEDDEQRISFIAEIQSRIITARWMDMVIQRRRCVAWKDGYDFQQTNYCMPRDFGVGAE